MIGLGSITNVPLRIGPHADTHAVGGSDPLALDDVPGFSAYTAALAAAASAAVQYAYHRSSEYDDPNDLTQTSVLAGTLPTRLQLFPPLLDPPNPPGPPVLQVFRADGGVWGIDTTGVTVPVGGTWDFQIRLSLRSPGAPVIFTLFPYFGNARIPGEEVRVPISSTIAPQTVTLSMGLEVVDPADRFEIHAIQDQPMAAKTLEVEARSFSAALRF
jgi:hypothetical protein